MNIKKEFYGNAEDGTPVDIYTLTNDNGMIAKITNYGAILVELHVPDKNGKLDDVVLGYGSLEEYFKNGVGFGSTIGRNSNRIGGAQFTLNGVVYNLDKNDNNNNLHSGYIGYNKHVYDAEGYEDEGSVSIELSRLSPHMEQGFPGNFDYSVTYTLTDEDELVIEYFGVSDQDTVVNLTNHSYFNLSGHDSGTILDHKLMINSVEFTVSDKESIPTGEIRSVKGTPFDFTSFKRIGDDIENDYDQLKNAFGYDHNYVLQVSGDDVEKVAELIDEKSGRIMEVYTDMPGMHLYAGNYLGPREISKSGKPYCQRAGLCFETQHFPNAINIKEFPSPVLKASTEYSFVTVFKFSNI